MQGASPLHPFDLHVLSTPPAFILSQNQTLKLMVQSRRFRIDGSDDNKICYRFLLTLLWVLMFSKKLTETVFLCYKKSFLSYSIFNLREPNNSSVLTSLRSELVYHNTLTYIKSSVFSNFFRFFLNFFKKFFDCLLRLSFFADSLHIISQLLHEVKRFFTIFWRIFENFFVFRPFSF